jgi:energy-coupling factor transport system permease protein
MYHTATWVLWLVAALFPAMLTKNPLYLTVLLAAVAVNYGTIGSDSPLAGSWRVFLRAGLVLIAFGVIFSTLTAHHGQTVLFTLPRLLLRAEGVTFLDLGGEITLEALAYGFANGLNLMAILMVFATFNMLADHHQLLRAIPRFMYQMAIVASIAIAFVPQMVSSLKDIREAQAIRGHRFRGIRDLLPLFIPLLTSGLERAVQLAESMEARGFGSATRPSVQRREIADRALVATALFGLLVGAFWYTYYAANRWPGVSLVFASLSMLGGIVMTMSRRVARSRYQRELWRRRDSVVSIACIVCVVIIAWAWMAGGDTLRFYPYPQFSFPSFSPLIGLALMALAAPALAAPRIRRRGHDSVPRRQLRVP